MRSATFVLALAALAFTSVDFWQRTRPRLRQVRELQATLRSLLDEGIERAKREGAPPSEEEVASARKAARELEQEAAALRREWFADARRPSDYLLPRAARPSAESVGEERDRIAQALLALPPELKMFPGITLARLGVASPSLSEPFPSEPGFLAEQAERAAAVRHLLAALRSVAAARISDATLQRAHDGLLVLRLEADLALSDAVALYCGLLARGDAAAPNRLRRLELRRLPPSEWGLDAKSLPAPPVRLRLVVNFERHASDGGAAR